MIFMSYPLTGVKVLVTRPAHQAEHLCQLIEAEGGEAVRLPAIDIVEIEDKSALLDYCATMDELDILIFISVNAVEKALPTLLKQGELPPHIQIAAVGKRTAESLEKYGIVPICPEPPYNSETLLKMPELEDVKGKNIVIFRGQGGRELLADSLKERGATVNYVDVYRRTQPMPLIFKDKVDIVTVTSEESMRNLFAMLDGQSWIKHTPMIVISKRLSVQARKLGLQAPLFIASTASDEGLLSAIFQWYSAHH
jgi:uroporphyrinogen-III synthase